MCIYARVVDAITNQIEHYMDLLSARQKLVVSNLANIDTPGYKTKDIDFQFEFISLAQGQAPNVVDTPGLVVKSDGNNVSLDRESRLLAETALRFNVASNLMQGAAQDRGVGHQRGTIRMSLFSVLSVSASGMAAQRTRAELVVQNLANSETTRTPKAALTGARMQYFKARPKPRRFPRSSRAR